MSDNFPYMFFWMGSIGNRGFSDKKPLDELNVITLYACMTS